MELMFSPLSPYVRKVMIVAHELGIAQRLRLNKINTREEPDRIAPLNPLGKIPTLVTDAGAQLYDSPVYANSSMRNSAATACCRRRARGAGRS